MKPAISIVAIAAISLCIGCGSAPPWDPTLHPPVRSGHPCAPAPHQAAARFPSAATGFVYVPPTAKVRKGVDHPEWRARNPRQWHYIIVHHSASSEDCAATIDAAHLARGWDGLGYNFVIDNGACGTADGGVETAQRWVAQVEGAHAGVPLYNEEGIGVVLIGNFEETRPTAEQMAALVELVRWLQKEYNIPASNVLRHKDIKPTLCPGKNFPWAEFKSKLR